LTYKNCKKLIEAGRYTYDRMYEILDLFLLVGRLNDDQYTKLTGMLTTEGQV